MIPTKLHCKQTQLNSMRLSSSFYSGVPSTETRVQAYSAPKFGMAMTSTAANADRLSLNMDSRGETFTVLMPNRIFIGQDGAEYGLVVWNPEPILPTKPHDYSLETFWKFMLLQSVPLRSMKSTRWVLLKVRDITLKATSPKVGQQNGQL
jgi:hypothetical protein